MTTAAIGDERALDNNHDRLNPMLQLCHSRKPRKKTCVLLLLATFSAHAVSRRNRKVPRSIRKV
jgi:hypothetical protein